MHFELDLYKVMYTSLFIPFNANRKYPPVYLSKRHEKIRYNFQGITFVASFRKSHIRSACSVYHGALLSNKSPFTCHRIHIVTISN